nr:hypothetical protein [Tanacetum cinerariifolium]
MTEAEQMKLAMKRSLQQTHVSQASGSSADERTGIILGVLDVPTEESDKEISWKSSDEDDDDEVDERSDDQEEDDDQDDDDQDDDDQDEGNDDASLGLNVGGEEGQDEEDDDVELYRDVNINLEGIDSLFETTPRVDVQASTTVAPFTLTALTLPPPTIPQVPQAPTPLTTAPSTLLAISSIFDIVKRYMDQRINEAVKVAVQIQSDRLQDEAQAENEKIFNNLDENIEKIIKEKVKEQVKVQVSKILLKIEKTVNEQLEAEVLTRSSNSSNTSYAVAADLSKMELKKILIEKMESNKRCDDVNKDEELSLGSDRGSKRRREGKEPKSTSAPKEKATKTTSKSTQGSKSHQQTASEEMLHISPRIPNQTFDELSFEEEILAFLRYLGHSRETRKLTDVNINKLHPPWRSFAAIINKCLSGKSIGYDSLRLSQAHILWGMYHKKKFGVMLHVELTNEDIKNSAAYKEYYVIASGAAPPKMKASVRKTQSSFDTTMPPPTANSSDEDDDEEVDDISDDQEDEDDQDDDDDDDQDDDDQDDDDQDTDKDDDDLYIPSNDDASLGMNVGGEEGQDAEDDDEELYRDVNINQEGRDVQMTDVHTTQEFKDTHVTLTPVNPDGQQQSSLVSSQFVTSMLNRSPDAGIDSLFESTPRVDVQASTTVAPLTLTAPTLPPPTIPTISQVPQAPTPPTTAPSTFLQDLLNFGSLFRFNQRLKTLESNFSEFVQTNQFAQAKNEEFLNNLDENIQKIIKEQVKEQVKVEVSKILLKIKKTVNKQLEAKVLTRSSNSSKTSYAVAAHLSEMELKKILIEKMESNKSIHRSDEQRNIYKALVDAYKSDKIILDTYGDTVTLKRRRDDADKYKEPSAGSDRGSKRRREGKEPESTSAPKEKVTKTTGKSTQGSKSPQKTTSESTPAEGQGRQLKGRRVIPFDHFINNDLEYLRGSASSRKYTTSVTKIKEANYGHIKWIKDLVPRTMWSQELVSYDKYALWGISHWGSKLQQFYGFVVNRESARDVYSRRSIIAVTELQIIEWHDYKHLDWITVRRDDDKLYKFKEGNFKRLRIQEIKDMSLLLVQGKLTNLTVEERFAFNIYLKMFTRSIVIQRRVKDL